MEVASKQPAVPVEPPIEATAIANAPAAAVEPSRETTAEACTALAGLADEDAESDHVGNDDAASETNRQQPGQSKAATTPNNRGRGRAGPPPQSSRVDVTDCRTLDASMSKSQVADQARLCAEAEEGGSVESSRTKRRPKKDSKSGQNAQDSEALVKQRYFIVKQHLHLGLGLRLNATYSESELRRRCNGCNDTLAKLEKFFQQPTALVEVAEGDAQATPRRRNLEKGSRCNSREAQAPATGDATEKKTAEPAKKKARKEPTFVVGQVVWATSNVPARPAKIVEIAPGEEGEGTSYKIRHLDIQGAEEGDVGEIYVDSFALEAVDVSHLLRCPSQQQVTDSDMTPALFRAPSEPLPEAKPQSRDRRSLQQPPRSGDVVWVVESGHMPWPGKVVGDAEKKNGGSGDDAAQKIVQVQMLGTHLQQPDGGTCMVTSISMERLLPFRREDIPTLTALQPEVESLLAQVASRTCDTARSGGGDITEDSVKKASDASVGTDLNKGTESSIGMAQPQGGAIVPAESADATTVAADAADPAQKAGKASRVPLATETTASKQD